MTATLAKTIKEEVEEIIDYRIRRETLGIDLVPPKHLDGDEEAALAAITQQCACELAIFIEALLDLAEQAKVEPGSVLRAAHSELRDIEKICIDNLRPLQEGHAHRAPH